MPVTKDRTVLIEDKIIIDMLVNPMKYFGESGLLTSRDDVKNVLEQHDSNDRYSKTPEEDRNIFKNYSIIILDVLITKVMLAIYSKITKEEADIILEDIGFHIPWLYRDEPSLEVSYTKEQINELCNRQKRKVHNSFEIEECKKFNKKHENKITRKYSMKDVIKISSTYNGKIVTEMYQKDYDLYNDLIVLHVYWGEIPTNYTCANVDIAKGEFKYNNKKYKILNKDISCLEGYLPNTVYIREILDKTSQEQPTIKELFIMLLKRIFNWNK